MTTTDKWKVTLEENKPLAKFQKVRTEAITEMFDSVDSIGLYPTSKFFARIDNCVRELLAEQAKAFVDGLPEGKNQSWDGVPGGPAQVHREGFNSCRFQTLENWKASGLLDTPKND